MISGRMFTGRDAVHSHLMKHEPPVDLRGSVLYHCGPVVVKEGDGWRVTAAGPTTSIREEPYQGEIIQRYGVRAVIGKGGMGAKTLAALKEHGAVYLNAIGGAAQFYARSIKQVDGVSLLEFGTPEAMWHLTVEDFPAIVTMDAHGNTLHKDIEQESGQHLETSGVGKRRARGRRRRWGRPFKGRLVSRRAPGAYQAVWTLPARSTRATWRSLKRSPNCGPPASLLRAHDRVGDGRRGRRSGCVIRGVSEAGHRTTTAVRWRRGCFGSRTIDASTSCAGAGFGLRPKRAAHEPRFRNAGRSRRVLDLGRAVEQLVMSAASEGTRLRAAEGCIRLHARRDRRARRLHRRRRQGRAQSRAERNWLRCVEARDITREASPRACRGCCISTSTDSTSAIGTDSAN